MTSLFIVANFEKLLTSTISIPIYFNIYEVILSKSCKRCNEIDLEGIFSSDYNITLATSRAIQNTRQVSMII